MPTPKIQGPNVGTNSLDGITPFFQIPRVVVPAGMTDVDLRARVRAERRQDRLHLGAAAEGTPKTKLPQPMPIAITFFAGQGEEPTLIKIGTAYESATHHRFAPPDVRARRRRRRRPRSIRRATGGAVARARWLRPQAEGIP